MVLETAKTLSNGVQLLRRLTSLSNLRANLFANLYPHPCSGRRKKNVCQENPAIQALVGATSMKPGLCHHCVSIFIRILCIYVSFVVHQELNNTNKVLPTHIAM